MTDKTLESLVPPLDLCKRIPQGKFADSALVYGNPMGWSPCLYPQLVTRSCDPSLVIAPAPTLEEIMEALARLELCPGIDLDVNIKGEVCGFVNAACRNVSFCGGSSATAALRLWFDVKGRHDA